MRDLATGSAFVVLPAATGLFAAAALRVEAVAGRLLAAYLIGWAVVLGPELLLSPVRRLAEGWMVAAELALAVAAAGAWLATGRPRLVPELGLRAVRLDGSLALLLAAVAAALLYDLALVLKLAPNTYDSLTYHLPRAAQWLDHGGWYWIENAATARLNVFPPGAELGILYSFLAFGSDRLAELPQLLGLLATLVGIVGLARRTGFGPAEALFAALLFATFSVVALEATTTQNDLVVTSFGLAAAYFAVSDRRADAALAGLALALGLGTKTTVARVLPGVVMLAVAASSRRRLLELAGFTVLFALLFAVPAYARNIVQTSSLLSGDGIDEHKAELSPGGLAATAVRVSYRFLDASGYGHIGLPAAVLDAPSAGAEALADLLDVNVNPAGATVSYFDWDVNERADEDVSYFGPLAPALLLAAAIVAVRQARASPWRTLRLALALSIPTAVVLVAVEYKYNAWLGRFMIAPVALTAPLLASLHRYRLVALAAAVLGSLTLALALLYSVQKPSGLGRVDSAWTRSREQTFTQERGNAARSFSSYDRLVPRDACVGALFGNNDILYPLYDERWRRRIVYLPRYGALAIADVEQLDWVVVSPVRRDATAELLQSGDWRTRELANYLLVLERVRPLRACSS